MLVIRKYHVYFINMFGCVLFLKTCCSFLLGTVHSLFPDGGLPFVTHRAKSGLKIALSWRIEGDSLTPALVFCVLFIHSYSLSLIPVTTTMHFFSVSPALSVTQLPLSNPVYHHPTNVTHYSRVNIEFICRIYGRIYFPHLHCFLDLHVQTSIVRITSTQPGRVYNQCRRDLMQGMAGPVSEQGGTKTLAQLPEMRKMIHAVHFD